MKMFNTLILKFDNLHELKWKISDSNVAQRWAHAVKDSLENIGFPDSCHFQNFSKNPLKFYYDKMKSAYINLRENIKDIPDIEDIDNVDLNNLNIDQNQY